MSPENTAEFTIPLFDDSEAQTESAEELKDVRHIKLEELLFRHESKMEGELGITFAGQGQEALGFVLTDKSGEKVFFKIFKGIIPPEIMKDFLQKTGIRRETILDSDHAPLGETEFNQFLKSLIGGEANRDLSATQINTMQRKAFALKKGHQLLPHRIPELQAVLTWDGTIAGFSLDFITGKAEPIDRYSKEYEADIELLKSNDIGVDDFHEANNAIREKDGTVRFIDVTYEGKMT